MSDDNEIWTLSNRASVHGRQIADRHYNRQKPGTPQFVPPAVASSSRTLRPRGSRPGPSLSTSSISGRVLR